MPATVRSVLVSGVGGTPIDIECNLSNGLPGIVIVGIASKSVDEAKERIRSAYSNSQLKLPRKRITINLAPADIPKEGTGFDLAIATAIMTASGQVSGEHSRRDMFFGELGLDGSVRPIRGIIGKLMAGKALGTKRFWLPEENLKQAILVPGINLVPVKSLKETASLLNQPSVTAVKSGSGHIISQSKKTDAATDDFKFIVGQAQAKRALEIAAAGNHNVLLSGPPGVGKSLMAKALATIMPPLTQEQIAETTHIHSLAGKNFQEIVVLPPFRAPHHSSSDISIIGGGQNPRPGEISMSHNGVLFLDELPEFSRSSIEALRQPLEDKIITVARAKDTLRFPANFILVATQNPCPCGYFGTSRQCICLPNQILNYQKKVSGPILDRIDLFIHVGNIPTDQILQKVGNQEPSEAVQQRVIRARSEQFKRQNKLNGALSSHDIKKLMLLKDDVKSLLDQAASKFELSARAYLRIIRIAQTIADLENSSAVTFAHVSEALQYRYQPQEL